MRNYFGFSLWYTLVLWSVTSAFFGMSLIVSRSDILGNEEGRLLVKSFFLFLITPVFLSAVYYGFLRFFGIKFEGRIPGILNENIINGKIAGDIGNDKIKKLYEAVSAAPNEINVTSTTMSMLVAVWVALTALLLKIKIATVIIILFGGIFAVLLVYLFTGFFIEYRLFPVFREIRNIYKKKGGGMEVKQFFSLRERFNYFILFFFLVSLMFLTFIPKLTFNLALLLAVGFIMILSIERVLIGNIYKIFEEIKFFSEQLPKKEKVFFASGSFNQEALDLSDNLNKSAEELYEAREKERKLAEELEKKVQELEKWYKLTVGRELRMVELKQKIKELESEVKKQSSQPKGITRF